MNLAMHTCRVNVHPARGESERHSFTRETVTCSIEENSMGANLNTRLCVTGRADNRQGLWYTFWSPGGPQKVVSGCDDCSISGPRTMFGGSVSGGDEMVTSEVEGQGFNAAVTPRGELWAKKETSCSLHGQMKRSGLFSDKRERFTVLSGGGSS